MRKVEGMGGLFGTIFGRDTMSDVTSELFWSAVKAADFNSPRERRSCIPISGPALLGNLLARPQHDSFTNMFQKIIGEPLEMPDTTIRPDEDQLSRWAQGYRSIVRLGPVALTFEAEQRGARCLGGHGRILLHRLGHAQIPESKPPGGHSPLLESMRLSHEKLDDWRDDLSLGMNWLHREFEGHRFVWHNGRMSGHRCFIGFNPERKVAITIPTNPQVYLDWYGADLLKLLSEDDSDESA